VRREIRQLTTEDREAYFLALGKILVITGVIIIMIIIIIITPLRTKLIQPGRIIPNCPNARQLILPPSAPPPSNRARLPL
jgi:hypothetical protein